MLATDQRLQQTINDYLPEARLINYRQLNNPASPQQTFHVITNQQSLIIRLLKQEQTADTHLAKLLSKKGLSPTYLHYNQQTHAIIFTFIKGQTLTINDLLIPSLQQRLLIKLKKLHHLKPFSINKAATSLERTKYYLDKVDTKFTEQAELINQLVNHPLTQKISTLLAETTQSCLIHNDLHLGNIIKETTQQLWVIDWDEAGMGDPYLDLAELSMYLDPNQYQQLLANYLQRPAKPNELAHLELQRSLRYLLFAAWSLTQPPPTTQTTKVNTAQSVAQLLSLASTEAKIKPVDFCEFFTSHYQVFLQHQLANWLVLYRDIK